MEKRKSDSTRYKVAIIAFVLGIAIIVIPYPYKDKEDQDLLPETGIDSHVTLNLSANMQDVEMDDPTSGAQDITYNLEVSNVNECGQNPLHAFLVIDNSGSELDYFNDVQNTARSIVNSIDVSRDKLGIISIGKRADVIRGLTNDLGTLHTDITSLEVGGFTSLDEGIDLAYSLLIEDPEFSSVQPAIIIISDGFIYSTDSSYEVRSITQEKASIAKNKGISLAVFGIGPIVDRDFLQSISSDEKTLYFEGSTRSNIASLFSSLLSDPKSDSFDTKVYVDLTLYKDIILVKDISGNGVFGSNQIIWDIGLLQCQEENLFSFTVQVKNNVEDLTQINLIAAMENSTGVITTSNSARTTIHIPVFQIDITDDSTMSYPGDTNTYIISIENTGSGSGHSVIIKDIYQPDIFDIDENLLEGKLLENGVILWDNTGLGFVIPGTREKVRTNSKMKYSIVGVVREDIPSEYTELNQYVSIESAHGFSGSTIDVNTILREQKIGLSIDTDRIEYVFEGDLFTYTVTLINLNNILLENTPVLIDYDESLLSIEQSDSLVDTGSVLEWNPGSVTSGGKSSISFTVRASSSSGLAEIPIHTSLAVDSDTVVIDERSSVLENRIFLIMHPVVSMSSFNTVVAGTDVSAIPIDKSISNISKQDSYKVYILEKIPDEFRYVVDSASSIEGVKPIWIQEKNTLSWDIGNLPSNSEIPLSYTVVPNENVMNKNYLTESTIYWEDMNGKSYEDKFFTTVINYNESGSLASSDFNLSELLERNIFNTFFESGEWALYLKVIIGLILAIPFPMMLIYSGHKEVLSFLGQRISTSIRRKRKKRKKTTGRKK